MPKDTQEQPRWDDREVARLIGKNCGLGEVQAIARPRTYWVALSGGLLAFVAGIGLALL